MYDGLATLSASPLEFFLDMCHESPARATSVAGSVASIESALDVVIEADVDVCTLYTTSAVAHDQR